MLTHEKNQSRSTSRRAPWTHRIITATALTIVGCDLDGAEATRIDVPVVIETNDVVLAINEHWTLELDHCRGVVEELVFTTGGAWYASLAPSLVRTAWAHPGHQGGGEVVGELAGRHVVDWCDPDDEGRVLGVAQILEFDLQGANFVWGRAEEQDVAADDPLLGHSLRLEGRLVKRDAQGTITRTRSFAATLDLPAQSGVVGVPMPAMNVPRDGDVFAFEFVLAPFSDSPTAPVTDSIFAGLDMAPWVDAEIDMAIEPGSPDHDRLRDAALTHDYFRLTEADALE